MGMDLIGEFRKKTPKEIVEKNQDDACLHYNWSGWSFLLTFLEKNGVDMDEFCGDNGGERLSRKTCKAVAECLEANIGKLKKFDQVWLYPHIQKWKWVVNYRQC